MIIFHIVITFFIVSFLVSATRLAADAPSLPPSAPVLHDTRDTRVTPGSFPAAALMALARHSGNSAGRIALALKAADTGSRTGRWW